MEKKELLFLSSGVKKVVLK